MTACASLSQSFFLFLSLSFSLSLCLSLRRCASVFMHVRMCSCVIFPSLSLTINFPKRLLAGHRLWCPNSRIPVRAPLTAKISSPDCEIATSRAWACKYPKVPHTTLNALLFYRSHPEGGGWFIPQHAIRSQVPVVLEVQFRSRVL